ncbi:HET-domain-containing protein, partial [Patellaria atrata CBS 101060]
YICLSHCWGETQPITTTPETLHERKSSIAIDTLPKTYKDAIMLTRALSKRYLWIDSLCIVQAPHPNPDWERESAKMGWIFRNAFCTISASAATTGSEGCFSSELRFTKSVPVSVQCRTSDYSGTVFFSLIPSEKLLPNNSFREQMLKAPVNTRGWCLQEQILASRIIHCCPDQIYVQCNKHVVGENGYIFDYARKSPLPPLLKHFLPPPGIYCGHMKRCFYFNRAWCTVTEMYSHRHLTQDSDRLPAISGLASALQLLVDDRYFAGLWLSCLHRQLLWFGYLDKQIYSPYRAPSWSWISH